MDTDVEHDPRPIYEGDWLSATPQQKGRHGAAVKAWSKRRAASAAQRSGLTAASPASGLEAGDGPRERHSDDLAALQAMIDGPKVLASDRIRAIESKQRILSRVEEAEREEAYGPLVALRGALDALPPEERVGALHTLLTTHDA